ncbi:MAG: Gfo/Idh/MocA family protein [Thermoguttaceae bacterium]
MSSLSRRSFLKRAAATAGAGAIFTIAGTRSSGSILGANGTVRIGVAGIHGRGQVHMSEFARMPGVKVTYLIDPDASLHESRAQKIRQMGGNAPHCVQDIRKALEDKNLDAISIASCNHWHALMTIWACQAGKDVYVEKPMSHNVFEGRKCVEAAEKYKRIVQHGTQSRSVSSWRKTVAAIASGKYGKLRVSKGYASKVRWSIGFKSDEPAPETLDFNLWLGPASKRPFNRHFVHYNWHWFWDFGNGEIGNQGAHQMDVARWGIPGGTLPKRVLSMGGRWVESTAGKPPFTDQAETPNMQVTVYDYGDCLLVMEIAGLNNRTMIKGNPKPQTKVANEFYTTEGVLTSGEFTPRGADKSQSLGVEAKTWAENEFNNLIFKNFIDCVRSRKREDLHADVLEAHRSVALCHLGNISYRLGEQVPGNTPIPVFGDNEEVQKSWRRIKQGLKDALGLDLASTTYQLGKLLEFDPEKEQFVSNEAANKLLTREYREPFVVPATV